LNTHWVIVALLYAVYKLGSAVPANRLALASRLASTFCRLGDCNRFGAGERSGPISPLPLMLRVTQLLRGNVVLYFAVVNALKLPIYVGAHILTLLYYRRRLGHTLVPFASDWRNPDRTWNAPRSRTLFCACCH